jgi:ectoine hydroxylase-related dioxygenase (phytanoyl-CoA dioxygenase family)
MSTSLKILERKLTTFGNDPLGVLRRRALFGWQEMLRCYQKVRERTVLSFPVYNLCYWYLNRTPKKLYELEQPKMALSLIQQRIVHDLKQTGIAVVQFEDLFTDKKFAPFQEVAEGLVQDSAISTAIETIKKGEKFISEHKFYLIRPLGHHPIYDAKDKFLELSLTNELLGIVCSYLGMFTRLMHLEHWCNVPTEGADTYSQRWHRDPDDKKLVKVFVYIRDVDETGGPFTYVAESHNGGRFSKIYPQTIRESHYPPEGKVEQRFSRSQIRVCTGKAGTIILCDTSGLHRGGHPTKNIRLLFTCIYTSNANTVRNENLYSISNGPTPALSAAAQYAIGHLCPR